MTKREAVRLTGLKADEFEGLRLACKGFGVDTFGILLAKDVENWGAAGDYQFFPVIHDFEVRP